MSRLILIPSFLIALFADVTGQTLSVDGRLGTLVANVGQMPSITLNAGTYTVSLSGAGIKLYFAQPQPYQYVILWEANTNRHWFIKADSPQTIVLEQQPAPLFAFLVDVNSIDSSGEVILTFTQGSFSQTLRVSGSAGTLVADVGRMPNITLNPGTYSVSLSGSGIKLYFAQPQPYQYVILWEANTNRHWFIKAGSPQTIILEQQPTTLFAFLVDVNNIDSSGEVTLTFTSQPGTSILSVIPPWRNVSSAAGTTTFDVANTGSGTMNWTAAVTSGTSWLSITSGGSGTNSGTITVAYSANTGASSRTGSITITAPGAIGSPKTVTITQPWIGGAGIRPVCPARVSGSVNTEFDVYIEIVNVQNLFGVSFLLNFNKVFLNAISETAESFLGNDVLFFGQHDNNVGTVSIGISRKSGQSGASGSGNVVRIRFKVVQGVAQDTPITFTLSQITANDASGNLINLQAQSATTTLGDGLIVWPGDANNDHVVNQADVLPIGLYFGKTGPRRTPGGCTWQAQTSEAWSPENATYADCNGDGTINQADVLCIGLNWNRTHAGAVTSISNQILEKGHSVNSGVLVPEVIPSNQAPGQEFFIRIKALEVTNLFGLAFELLYSPANFLQIISVEPDDFFGSDVVLFPNVDAVNGKVSVGISRKSGQTGVSGAGSVVRIKAKIVSNAHLGQSINLSLQNVIANDSNGASMDLSPQSSSIFISVTSVDTKAELTLPSDYQLHQNYPNPFNPSTGIRYQLPRSSTVELIIQNTLGQKIRTLVSNKQAPGDYEVVWNGKDDVGNQVPSGVYIYQLKAGEFVDTRKLLLLR